MGLGKADEKGVAVQHPGAFLVVLRSLFRPVDRTILVHWSGFPFVQEEEGGLCRLVGLLHEVSGNQGCIQHFERKLFIGVVLAEC